MAPSRTWTDVQLRLAVTNSRSYSQVMDALGLAHSGGSYRTIVRHIAAQNLDTSHFIGRSWERIGNPAPGNKICGKCREEKLLTEFHRRRNGYQSHCKMCRDDAGRNQCLCGRLKGKRYARCRACREEDVQRPRTEISATEIAWIAGILEGEGCWTTKGQRKSWWIAVRMTDEDVVNRLPVLTGIGNVTIEESKRGYKTTWAWGVGTRPHREWLTLLVWPWLGSRRRARIRELWPDVDDALHKHYGDAPALQAG